MRRTEAFNHTKVEGLIRRAGLRYPAADLRRLDLVEERGLDRNVIAALGTCGFIDRQQNVVFQGFTGSGKSYLGCAVAKQACQHRTRAHYTLYCEEPNNRQTNLTATATASVTGHGRPYQISTSSLQRLNVRQTQ